MLGSFLFPFLFSVLPLKVRKRHSSSCWYGGVGVKDLLLRDPRAFEVGRIGDVGQPLLVLDALAQRRAGLERRVGGRVRAHGRRQEAVERRHGGRPRDAVGVGGVGVHLVPRQRRQPQQKQRQQQRWRRRRRRRVPDPLTPTAYS